MKYIYSFLPSGKSRFFIDIFFPREKGKNIDIFLQREKLDYFIDIFSEKVDCLSIFSLLTP